MNTGTHAYALCAIGLEKVLSSELKRIGLEVAGREAGRVRFALGPDPARALARSNLCLRTAERVLVEAGTFPAADFDQLFETTRQLPWEDWFRKEDRLVIERVRLRDSQLSAQTSVQSVVHKAIYERLSSVFRLARMPETGAERSLRVYIESDKCLLGLDSSGEALHRRGYRRSAVEAPLKETLAAGSLLLAGWSRRMPLLDPFCGSGTIAVEAALLALDRAPGLGRSFGFLSMPIAEGKGFAEEEEAAAARVLRDLEFRIEGCDIDPRALEAARANAAKAGVGAGIVFRQAKAEDARPAYDSGFLVCNPPYGERLGTKEESEELYRQLGGIANRFRGWSLGFITNRFDFGDFFGRYAENAFKIINGAEEQWLHVYPAGSDDNPGRRPEPQGRRRSPVSESRAEGRSTPDDRGTGRSKGRSGSGRGGEGAGGRGDTPPRRPWVGPDKPGWEGPPSTRPDAVPKKPRRRS